MDQLDSSPADVSVRVVDREDRFTRFKGGGVTEESETSVTSNVGEKMNSNVLWEILYEESIHRRKRRRSLVLK